MVLLFTAGGGLLVRFREKRCDRIDVRVFAEFGKAAQYPTAAMNFGRALIEVLQVGRIVIRPALNISWDGQFGELVVHLGVGRLKKALKFMTQTASCHSSCQFQIVWSW